MIVSKMNNNNNKKSKLKCSDLSRPKLYYIFVISLYTEFFFGMWKYSLPYHFFASFNFFRFFPDNRFTLNKLFEPRFFVVFVLSLFIFLYFLFPTAFFQLFIAHCTWYNLKTKHTHAAIFIFCFFLKIICFFIIIDTRKYRIPYLNN